MEEPIEENEKLSYDDAASNEPEKKESYNQNYLFNEIDIIEDSLKNDHFFMDVKNVRKIFSDILINLYKKELELSEIRIELSEIRKEIRIEKKNNEQLLLKNIILENEIKSLNEKCKSPFQSFKETLFGKSNHLSESYKNQLENNNTENYFSKMTTQNDGFSIAYSHQKTIAYPQIEISTKPSYKTLIFNFYSINSEFYGPINRFFKKIGPIEVKDKKKKYILKIEDQIDGLSNNGNTINLNKVEEKEIKNNQCAALVIYCSGGRVDFSIYMDVIRELEKMYKKRMIIFKLVGGNDSNQFQILGDHLQIALNTSFSKEIYYNDDNIENIMSLCKLIGDKKKL